MKPYPVSYMRFVALFNHELFWESHEVLEAPWRVNASPFYKGLIIFASAFVHVQRGNPVGVRKQLEKCLRYLADYTPHYLGLDVHAILAHCQHCHALAAANPTVTGVALADLIPLYPLTLDDALLRGDEPELQTEEPRHDP